MGLLNTRTKIITQINDNWTGTSLTTGVQWPNVQFNEPSSEPWVRLEIHPQQGLIATLGVNGFNEQKGTFFFTIFTLIGTSTITSYTLAEEFKTLFDRKTLDDIIFNVTSFNEITEAASVKWHHLACSIDFSYYEQ